MSHPSRLPRRRPLHAGLPSFLSPLLPAVALAMALLLAAGCGEETTGPEDGGTIPSDSTLPDGFVSGPRPPNPPTSFVIQCPLGEIEDPPDNPYFVSNGFPEGIPAVDQPEFVRIAVMDPTMDENERIIAVEYGGVVRGFPVRILLHHELVNMCWVDSTGQQYSFLTYCPLVDAAVHFVHEYPCYQTKGKSFGVSGFLYNGNLVMYDRGSSGAKSGTAPDLYSQLYGGGVFGTCLEVEPVIFDVTWSMFRKLFPGAKVLSENTGYSPPGGYDWFEHPYTWYWGTNDLFFPVSNDDSRLGRKMPVYSVITSEGAKAYITVGKTYVANDAIGSTRVVVWNDPNFGASAGYEPIIDGKTLTFSMLGRDSRGLPLYGDEETGSVWTFDGIAVSGPLQGKRLPHLVGYRVFWFAWASFYPGAELYNP